MDMTKHLLFIAVLLLSSNARAEMTSEEQTLRQAVQIAEEGGLGFTLPENWVFEYSDQYGACFRMSSMGCTPVAGEEPFIAGARVDPVWALTSPSAMHTVFYRDSASSIEKMGLAYTRPSDDEIPSVVFVAPQPFTALEMAAYVIGHEVDGHLNFGGSGATMDEMAANYYGLKAVQSLRAYLAQAETLAAL
jgi:hypothetical protein